MDSEEHTPLDSVTIHLVMDRIKDQILQYKKIKKKIEDRGPCTTLNAIVSTIHTTILELDSLDDNFKCIGMYMYSPEETSSINLSNYFINKDGIIITRTKIVKCYNGVYFLKPTNKNHVYKISKQKLIDYIFAR